MWLCTCHPLESNPCDFEDQSASYWNSKKWRSWIQWAMINCEKPSRKLGQNWLPPCSSPWRITCFWCIYVLLQKIHGNMSIHPRYSVQGASSMSWCSRTRSSLVEVHQWLLFWVARILVFAMLRHSNPSLFPSDNDTKEYYSHGLKLALWTCLFISIELISTGWCTGDFVNAMSPSNHVPLNKVCGCPEVFLQWWQTRPYDSLQDSSLQVNMLWKNAIQFGRNHDDTQVEQSKPLLLRVGTTWLSESNSDTHSFISWFWTCHERNIQYGLPLYQAKKMNPIQGNLQQRSGIVGSVPHFGDKTLGQLWQ